MKILYLVNLYDESLLRPTHGLPALRFYPGLTAVYSQKSVWAVWSFTIPEELG